MADEAVSVQADPLFADIYAVELSTVEMEAIDGGQQPGDYGETRAGTKAALRISEQKKLDAINKYGLATFGNDAINAVWFPGQTSVQRALSKGMDSIEAQRDLWSVNATRLGKKLRDWL